MSDAAFEARVGSSISDEAGDDRSRPAQAFWEKYFQFYDTLLESIPYQQMVERHVELLEPAPGERILDAGTGTGNVALALLATGARVTGIDFCEPALVKCRAKAPEADFRHGDLTRRLDFEDASFDKIACCNVIYTLEPAGQRNAVSELCRVLRPGGTAAITVFGDGFKALKVYAETLRTHRRCHGLPSAVALGVRYSINTARILYYVARIKRRERTGSYTFYTPAELTRLLEGGGFEVELVEPIFADQCLVALARKPAAAAGRP